MDTKCKMQENEQRPSTEGVSVLPFFSRMRREGVFGLD